jgi:formylglycine-generating enzyme required for sulfatase activity
MKMILALVGCVLAASPLLSAQLGTNTPAPAAKPITNSPAANGHALTNTPAAEAEGGTNEVTIEDLMKLPAFTNATGMVMVKFSGKLWVSAYETTQDDFKKIAGYNPSRFQGARNPVESVSWNEAMDFCTGLADAENEKKLLPEGFAYTLPTQAQWESFAAGAELKDAITSSGPTRSGTAPVGTLGATGPGLYDIRGNVCEWCLDPQDKAFRVARGAAWDSFIEINLRPEFRWYEAPEVRKEKIGFRVVLSPKS